jgi:hypothetical protein
MAERRRNSAAKMVFIVGWVEQIHRETQHCNVGFHIQPFYYKK